jgi:hypothetical protein
MSDGFQNPVQARLRRDLKAQRQFGLPKHNPTLFCPSVYILAFDSFAPTHLAF